MLLPTFLIVLLFLTNRFEHGPEAAEVISFIVPTSVTEDLEIPHPLRKFCRGGGGGLADLAGCFNRVSLNERSESGERRDRPNAGARAGWDGGF